MRDGGGGEILAGEALVGQQHLSAADQTPVVLQQCGDDLAFTNLGVGQAPHDRHAVAGYRSQNDVESGFRELKDPHVIGFSPMFHWTDSKIRVHVFYCALALALAQRILTDTDPTQNPIWNYDPKAN